MYPDSNYESNKETENGIYFFTPAFYPLDNFSAHAVAVWGKEFPTSEHAYQWKKYSIVAPGLAEQIFNAKSPNAVKNISDAHKDKVAPEFHKQKLVVMEEILLAKLNQHEDVKRKLLITGEKQIFENSPVDAFWGVGPDGNGQNHLGKLWMKIRESLK